MGFDRVACKRVAEANPKADVEQLLALMLDEPADGPPPLVDAPPAGAATVGPALPAPSAPAVIDVTGASDADKEMERAIELSLQEARDRDRFNEEIKGGRGYQDPQNPYDRKRSSMEVPAGIKNVGNTCYINSLLQAFFLYPKFRQEIFGVDVSSSPEQTGSKLIRELQLLFSRMLLTERRYVDPEPLLEFTSHHGAQEDPTELFLALLEKMRDGVSKRPAKLQKLAAADDEEEGAQPMDLREDGDDDDDEGDNAEDSGRRDLISQYFEGRLRQAVMAREENGAAVENVTQEQFQQIICSLPEGDAFHLHDLLEMYTEENSIEGYMTPLHFETTAVKSVMLEQLPPILTIQVQRVAWTNNALQKNNRKVEFDNTMFMDR